MKKLTLPSSAASLLSMALLLPALQGCFPLVATGVAVGAMSAHDRRQTGVQTDDETTEWKASESIPKAYRDAAHVNFTSYNRRLLITGEVPSEEARQQIEERAARLDGVKLVYNELTVGAASSLGSRSNDAYLTSMVKARLVDTNRQVAANHVKVVTENGAVHLMGILSPREAKVAVNVARTTNGVRKVVNLVEVLPEEDIRRLDAALTGERSEKKPAPVESR